MMNKLFKSVIDQDIAPVVICDVDSVIVYMNSAAGESYRRDLTGCNLRDCHSEESNKKFDQVLRWFGESGNNNIVYCYHNEKRNKDVYMVALRDDQNNLIGYYEKHEVRTRETKKPYDFDNA